MDAQNVKHQMYTGPFLLIMETLLDAFNLHKIHIIYVHTFKLNLYIIHFLTENRLGITYVENDAVLRCNSKAVFKEKKKKPNSDKIKCLLEKSFISALMKLPGARTTCP